MQCKFLQFSSASPKLCFLECSAPQFKHNMPKHIHSWIFLVSNMCYRFGKSECSALHVAVSVTPIIDNVTQRAQRQPALAHNNNSKTQVWHNKVPLVERLLEEGASPDVQDGESGW